MDAVSVYVDVIDQIKHSKFLWIYGAGIVARRVVQFLDKPFFDIEIRGIVVTKVDRQYEGLGCYDVCEVTEVNTPPESTLFIIAVSNKYSQEIIEILEKIGYNYVAWDWEIHSRAWELSNYKFIDRRQNLNKVCFVLAGYKNFLWHDVFVRLKNFVPSDVEVCILSSGKWDNKLAEIAERNNWSYFSTALNNITLIQNMAIRKFSSAKWIYKMDEDIFLTDNAFEKVMETYYRAETESHYEIGFSAPLIPLNGYGYIRLLKQLGKIDEYEEKFERAFCGGSPKRMVESCDEVAGYLWGLESDIPQLDKLNEIFARQNGRYSFCNVRFSIGFILYHRSFWEHFGGFDVSDEVGLGWDEEKMCKVCMNDSYAIVVAENTVVGHFSFGKQTQYMRKLYEENHDWFEAPTKE